MSKRKKWSKKKYEEISDKEFFDIVKEVEKRYGKALADLARI